MYTYNIKKMFGLKEWIHYYNHDMCGMMSYTISDKKFITDNIRVRLVPYSTQTYSYLYPRTSVFVFVSEAIRIRIRIRIKIWKQIWFQWYPSVFDPITSLIIRIRRSVVMYDFVRYTIPLSARRELVRFPTMHTKARVKLGNTTFISYNDI
jgi:hypothetical protein